MKYEKPSIKIERFELIEDIANLEALSAGDLTPSGKPITEGNDPFYDILTDSIDEFFGK